MLIMKTPTLRPIEGRTPNELETLFQDFINEQVHLRNARKATVEGYTAAMQLFLRTNKNADLRSIQMRETWVGFFSHLNQRDRLVGTEMKHTGVKSSTIRTYASKMNSFLRWLQATGHIKENALFKIELPQVEYVDRRRLTESEIQRLMQTCKYDIPWTSDFVRIRNYTMLRTLLFTGIRLGELLGLRVEDIKMDTGTIVVRAETSKSKSVREIPIHHELAIDLRAYLTARREHPIEYTTPGLFVSSTQDRTFSIHGLKHFVKKLVKESGVAFHVHRMRHTFAAEMNRHGVALNHLQQLMGHRSSTMTLVYGRNVSVDTLRGDVQKIGSDGFSP